MPCLFTVRTKHTIHHDTEMCICIVCYSRNTEIIFHMLYKSLLDIQAEECLKREKDRVSHYLHSSSEIKLLEVCSCS